MAWYTVNTYERSDPSKTVGVLIDVSTLEANSDSEAIAAARGHSLLSIRGDFANLLDPREKIIHSMERGDA